jgi:hypothetical protein
LGIAVIPRTVLTILVFALPLLVVAFGVLMAGAALAQATQDELAAGILRWIAMGVLMLAAVDMILLVGVLGLKALRDQNERPDSSDD